MNCMLLEKDSKLMIQVVLPSGETFHVSVNFFLKHFYELSYKFVPPDAAPFYDDLDNLVQLFKYLKEPALELYKYFLAFHAWNSKNNSRIYWELLDV